MTTSLTRRMVLVGTMVVALSAIAAVADAQEWKIYLSGKVEPIVASFYAEESPWVFFRDDESMYVFALGCNRIRKVERGGTEIPLPACPVEKLPTTMPRILVGLMDLEAKRLDDGITRLREQTRAYADAVVGSAVAARGLQLAGGSAADAERQFQSDVGAISFLRSQINDTLFDIRLTEQRVSALAEAAQAFPQPAKPRYFFAPR
jgi:hypothetical protein